MAIPAMPPIYPIPSLPNPREFPTITLCGSMRFASIMSHIVAVKFSLDGWVVFAPFVVFNSTNPDDPRRTPAAKAMLDRMHMNKISRSDAICIVTNPAHYIGESTANEILFADAYHKNIMLYDGLTNRGDGPVTALTVKNHRIHAWRVRAA